VQALLDTLVRIGLCCPHAPRGSKKQAPALVLPGHTQQAAETQLWWRPRLPLSSTHISMLKLEQHERA
jgi:hypothetical protein